jgi:ABC-2 type transport system ATP-binding protein
MLVADGVTKSYRTIRALDGFDLTIHSGEICGLVGRNGAGKTTFVDVVAGLVRPDAGRVSVAGLDVTRQPRRARRHIGLAPQELGLYPTVTVRQNLRLFGALAGLSARRTAVAMDETAEALRLTDLLDRPVGVLSGGQRRRVQAATALLHRPALLLLDEPTVGADPPTRQGLLGVIRQRAAEGAAVCYTTHYLPELEELDATVAVVVAGRVVARGDRSALLAGLPGALQLGFADGRSRRISTTDPARTLAEVLAGGARPSTVDIQRPGLDDLYRALAVPDAR